MAEGNDHDLDSYMMDFHPYRNGTNPNHTEGSDSQSLNYLKIDDIYDRYRKEEFCGRITEWLSGYLQSVLKEIGDSSLVVSIAPGHLKDSRSPFLCETVRDVLRNPKFKRRGVENGSSYLRRTKDVPKSTDGGQRHISTHLNSIEVTNPTFVEGKTVCVIDDIWTTGCTLRACARKMEAAGASNTKMIAVGKTV